MEDGYQRRQIVRRAPWNTHAQLHQNRVIKQALLLQPLGERQMAGVENLDLRAHAKPLYLPGHFPEHGGRVGHHIIAFTEIHRAAIQRADFRQEFSNMRKPFRCARHIGLGGIGRQRGFCRPKDQIAADTCRQVQHDIDTRRPDVVHNLAEKLQLARWLTVSGSRT